MTNIRSTNALCVDVRTTATHQATHHFDAEGPSGRERLALFLGCWARSMARVEGNGRTSSCNAFWCWDAIKSARWIMDLKSFAFWLGATGQSALHSAPTFVDGICINMFAPSKHNSDIDLGFAEFKRYDGCLWAFCSKVCNTCADRGPVFESGASVVKAVPSVSLCVSSN